jgi:tetratricopeptide (TPR) repeat protein
MQHLKKLVPILLLSMVFLAAPTLAKKDIDWDKRLAKGYHQMSIGNYEEAVKMFGSEVDKHPESGAARTALGMALKRQGKMGEAKASFRRATEVESGFAEGQYELGAMLENDKEYSEALKCFERYLQLAPLSSKKASVEDRIRFCKQKI